MDYKYCYSNEGAIYAKGLLCQKNQTKQFQGSMNFQSE